MSDSLVEKCFPPTIAETDSGMIVDGFQATSSLYDNSHSSLAHNWSPGKKLYVVSTGLFINFNTCLSAALPTGALETLTAAFNVTSQEQKALPVAV